MSTQPEHDPIRLVKQASLPSLVQKELERMILNGDLAAGAKLNEVALAEKLGVSRGPVREAFRSLEESGLVRQEKNLGVFVRQISVQEADEIYEVRSALDELVGRKLAVTITPAQLKEIRAHLDKMDKMVKKKDVNGYYLLNLEFHDLLVQYANNRKLLSTYRRVVNELNLYRRNSLNQQGTLPISTNEHHEIIDKIASGDPDAAAAAMREHVVGSRSRMHAAQSGVNTSAA